MAKRLRRSDSTPSAMECSDDASVEHLAEVMALDHPCAVTPQATGNKAAALARAAAAGFPVLPGFVLTTAWSGRCDDAVRRRWADLSGRGTRRLVVRSSSTSEDGESSSMAGRFTSVLDVMAWDDFVDAVDRVRASSDGAPMAVLVQPQLDAVAGGVLFTIDPVTGEHHTVVEAVAGGPSDLVDGTALSTHLVLGRFGHTRSAEGAASTVRLSGAIRRRLARLGHDVAAHAGRPQDLEWAVDRDGVLWLLQHRPVTAAGEVARRGPVLGSGPLAETFPEPLRPLEVDLWVDPLEEALVETLSFTGAASARVLDRRPPVRMVGGTVVADLEVLGIAHTRRSMWRALDPRPAWRRATAAWRVGRLRAALPDLVADLVVVVDDRLGAVPSLERLADRELIGTLQRARRTLVSLHGHEVLAGALLPEPGSDDPTAAEVALASVALLDDEQHLPWFPEVLALTAPSIGRVELPTAPLSIGRPAEVDDLPAREALRLRVRWVQELTARVAAEAGLRLTARGVLRSADRVALLRFDELAGALAGRRITVDPTALDARLPDTTPLPTTFRLTASGQPTPVEAEPPGRRSSARRSDGPAAGGRAAGGGRAVGPVHHLADGEPPEGSVLVVQHLTPDLAAHLPSLAGLVAETGSALSHLAILARELDVATVVAVPDALRRFPPGVSVVVDGGTGSIDLQSEATA